MTNNDLITSACDDLRAGRITYAGWLDLLAAADVAIVREEEK